MIHLAANTVVVDEGRVLLTLRTDFEVWCLPSGNVDEGESVADAAIRETKEETGIDVVLTRLVGVYSRLGALPDVHAVVFAARPVGGRLTPQPGETLDVRWFSPDVLPADMSFGHRRRVEDALLGVGGGVARLQRIASEDGTTLTRQEMVALRDRSSLSKSRFYRGLVDDPRSDGAGRLQVGDDGPRDGHPPCASPPA